MFDLFADDHPTNGDMHEVVKGKFFAFRGPVDRQQGDPKQRYTHVPSDYFEVFSSKGVRGVVRLNNAEYDARSVTEVSAS